MKFTKFLLLSIFCAIFFLFSYKFYFNNKFANALKEASKINELEFESKYQDIKTRNDYRVVIIAVNGGELSYAQYFKYSAEKIGWKVKIFNKQIQGHEDEILDFDPDFIILACYASPEMDSRITAHPSKKYSLNFVPFQLLRDKGLIDFKNPYKATKSLAQMNQIVHGVFTVANEIEIYKKMFELLNKDFYGSRVLPLVPEFDNEPATPKRIMWMGSGWDAYRSSKEYQAFIKDIASNLPFKVYGHYNSLSYLPREIYGGYISPGIDNIKAIRENGIYLLTHSDYHFKGNVPSMRPFEAAAANVVIISDKLPFLIEHFGDSLLYFDQEASPEERYAQVKSHLEWIKANPEKAKEKAAKANKIFREKFTIERDLVRIAKMHEYVLQEDKLKWNLDYPIGF